VKRIKALITFLVLAAALVIGPKSAFAAVPGTTAKLSTLTDTFTMYIGDTKGSVPTGAGVATGPSGIRNVWFAYTAKEGTIKNVNTTNYKVALAYAYPSEGKDHLWINAYKPGKTTLTFNYGKKKRTVKIVVKKYTNPIKKLTIGTKNYTSKLAKDARIRGALCKSKGQKVVVKPAAGWTVKAIYACKVDLARDMVSNWKTIANGSKVPTKCNSVEVVMQNKATGGLLRLYSTQ
jgi:hypothetical protein